MYCIILYCAVLYCTVPYDCRLVSLSKDVLLHYCAVPSLEAVRVSLNVMLLVCLYGMRY